MVKSVNNARAHLFLLSIEMAETSDGHCINPVGPNSSRWKNTLQCFLKEDSTAWPFDAAGCVSRSGLLVKCLPLWIKVSSSRLWVRHPCFIEIGGHGSWHPHLSRETSLFPNSSPRWTGGRWRAGAGIPVILVNVMSVWLMVPSCLVQH